MHSPGSVQKFSVWCLITALAFLGATITLNGRFITPVRGPLAFGIVGLTIVLLAVTVISFLRFVRDADELMRKIQVDALGVGFAAGAVFTLGYRLCERLGAPKLDVDDGFLVMMVFWALGQYLGYRRYCDDGQVEA